jgi:hypothetical protein
MRRRTATKDVKDSRMFGVPFDSGDGIDEHNFLFQIPIIIFCCPQLDEIFFLQKEQMRNGIEFIQMCYRFEVNTLILRQIARISESEFHKISKTSQSLSRNVNSPCRKPFLSKKMI